MMTSVFANPACDLRAASRSLAGSLAFVLAISLGAVTAGADDKQILEDLRSQAQPVDFRAMGIANPEEALKVLRERSDKAAELVKGLSPDAAEINEGRLLAIRCLTKTLQMSRKATDRAPLAALAEAVIACDKATKANKSEAAISLTGSQFLVLMEGVTSREQLATLKTSKAEALTQFADNVVTLVNTYAADNPETADFAARIAENLESSIKAPELAAKISDALKAKVPNHPSVAAAALGAVEAVSVGEVMAFRFVPVGSDKPLALSDLKGKVVVIDFWATWCPPCRAEMPHMKELYAQYKAKGVEFIGVSLDPTEDALKSYIAKEGITWPQCFGPRARKLSDAFRVTGIPTLFILDKDGKLHSTSARGKLDALIPELLGAK